MYIVGLTGGIGSGKSEAASCFAALGVPVIDTDGIAHRLTAFGMPAVDEIVRALGNDCLAPNGALDRAFLRGKVFSDQAMRRQLENILHPLICTAVIEELKLHGDAAYQIVVVPLLFETVGYRDMVDTTLVVDCSEEEQVRRTMARNKLREAEVRSVMAAQMPRAERLALADDILRNDGSLHELAQQVLEMHQKYLRLCRLG